MSAREPRPEDAWPLPPAWMWACQECADRYRWMKDAQRATEEHWRAHGPGVDPDPMDSVFSTQVGLAQHLADAHEDQLPDWDAACPTCATHRELIAKESRADAARADVVIRIGGEHRARHVFAAPSIVELY
ncbi:hypothetical protein WDH52_11555 [Streptomyces sp. TRM70308]|uniref:hypothetical protein n=1 Tax=Streptomyces sp. TRM70308 TaxID=3131932 RepID=UPI003CFC03B3